MASRANFASLAAVLLIGRAALAAGGARPLELEEAIGLALRQNRDLLAQELAVETRGLGEAAARTRYQFTLRPEGGTSADEDRGEVSAGLALRRETTWGTRAEAGAAASRQEWSGGETRHRGALRVRVDQPLLRQFGPLVNAEPLRLAAGETAAARRELELRRVDLVVRVVETHHALLTLQRQRAFDTQTVHRLESVLRLTRARRRQGRASAVDVLRAELQLGTAQSNQNLTEERAAALRADYADLLGLPPEEPLEALAGPPLAVEAPARPEDVTRTALSNRLDYAQILQDCEDAQRGVRIARRNLLPDLNLISRYEQVGEGDDAEDAAGLDDRIWFVGLAAGSDLPMRTERIELRQSLLDREAADLRLASVRAGIARQAQQALAACARAEKELPQARQNYEVASARARLARRLFDMGKGDSFSVAEGQEELSRAERKRLDAEAEAVICTYRLLRVLGTVVEHPEELKPGAVKP